MSSFFAILFLASLGFLVWGIISPKSLSKFNSKPLTRKDAGIGFGFVAVVMLVLTGATSPNLSTDTKQATTEVKSLTEPKAEKLESLPVVEVKTETKTEEVPFSKTSTMDSSRKKGTSAVTTPGRTGIKIFTYEVTYTDGKETDRKLVSEVVTVQPVTEVTSVGTKEEVVRQSNCDPNYSGACVPIASDVDCAGGSGNGPAYVRGPVTVIGRDIYDLDRDGKGTGCE